jgi:hypothetical protein
VTCRTAPTRRLRQRRPGPGYWEGSSLSWETQQLGLGACRWPAAGVEQRAITSYSKKHDGRCAGPWHPRGPASPCQMSHRRSPSVPVRWYWEDWDVAPTTKQYWGRSWPVSPAHPHPHPHQKGGGGGGPPGTGTQRIQKRQRGRRGKGEGRREGEKSQGSREETREQTRDQRPEMREKTRKRDQARNRRVMILYDASFDDCSLDVPSCPLVLP